MKRSRELSQSGIFKKTGVFAEKKQLKEEKMFLIAMREKCFPRIRQETMDELGEKFTEQAAEDNYKLFVQACYSKGIMEKMLGEYLQKKIAREREKYANPSPRK